MPAPRPTEVMVFADAAEFRAWLEQHHDTATEVWVGYYRKGVAKRSITYRQAVEEALCFGWIDGITRRIDDEVTANRYTPRRKGSGWSAVNIARVAELRAAGRMHPAGLRVFEERDRRKDASYSYERAAAELSPHLEQRLRDHADAWAYWQGRSPGYRRTATHWVMSAKRADTRERRMAALVEDCAAGRRIKPLR